MTLKKLLGLYKFHKQYYDFTLTGKSFRELDENADHEGEFIKD